MKNIKLGFLTVLTTLLLISCGSDDDAPQIELRDPQEVYDEDLDSITKFLQTHYYNEEDFQNAPDDNNIEIEFFEMDAATSGQTPLSELVTTKMVRLGTIDYKVFVLNIRQGQGDGRPTFADSTLVEYKGSLLNGVQFDSSVNSVWFDLPGVVEGFAVGIEEFNDAAQIIPNSDGTISYKGSGTGAMFFPSGLGYFNRPQGIIPPYSPLVFRFKLHKVQVTDHDGDGILSRFEDLNGDGRFSSLNGADDTDGDTGLNYLDSDDDNDGIPTRLENADPNGDGNPSDARDTDGDGIPDYLDNRTEV